MNQETNIVLLIYIKRSPKITLKHISTQIQKCHSPKPVYSSETKSVELWDSERQQKSLEKLGKR